jgi:hypothetical protein
MFRYKFVEVVNGVVANVLEVRRLVELAPEDIPATLTAVPLDTNLEAVRGCAYDAGAQTFGPRPTPDRVVSADEFFEMFTATERKAMYAAARGDALAVPPVLPNDDVEDLIQKVRIKRAVNLDSPKLTPALQLLQSLGIITADRAQRIAAGLPPL